jgi:hypothetical protein
MSKIGSLFKDVNINIEKENLIPVIELKDKNKKAELEEKLNMRIHDFDVIEKGINYLNHDINNFYINGSRSAHPYYYYKPPVLVDIHLFDIDFLKDFQVKERITHSTLMFNKALKDKDFFKIFALIDDRISLPTYEQLFDLIPDNEKFEIFLNVYSHVDYGFSRSKEFMKKVFAYKPKEIDKDLIKRAINDKVTIYRGENTESTPYNEAYSWSLNLSTAALIAFRFGVEGKIYQAKADINDILAYLENRSEDEVIIEPEKVKEVEEYDLLSVDQVISNLKENKYFNIYGECCRNLKKSYFFQPESIHGLLHTKRVLLLSLVLVQELMLNESELYILKNTAMYHDIGRINDGEDPKHGINSVKKIKDLKIKYSEFNNKYKKEFEIIKYIIENHNITDKKGIKNVDKYDIDDKERAIYLLKIFKDADGLDRVRLKDLDSKYLRLDVSKSLIGVAYNFLRYIQ